MNVDSWWKQPVGTKWVFEADFSNASGPAKRLAKFHAASDEDGKILIEYDLYNPPDLGATASIDFIWHAQDGYVVWACGDLEYSWRVFKPGSNCGDIWSGPLGVGTVANLGVEEVTVPAGTFSAVHIRITKAEDEKTHDFWFTPKEGLLQWDTCTPQGSAHLILRSYSRGS